jgi:hypothetical protein
MFVKVKGGDTMADDMKVVLSFLVSPELEAALAARLKAATLRVDAKGNEGADDLFGVISCCG